MTKKEVKLVIRFSSKESLIDWFDDMKDPRVVGVSANAVVRRTDGLDNIKAAGEVYIVVDGGDEYNRSREIKA